MKKYWKEIVVIMVQLALFYLLPLFGMSDPIGMVLLIIAGTFLLSLLMGGLSAERLKWLYSPLVCVMFLPSVFIYYNESALIHAVWYLIISDIGLLIGSVVRRLCMRK